MSSSITTLSLPQLRDYIQSVDPQQLPTNVVQVFSHMTDQPASCRQPTTQRNTNSATMKEHAWILIIYWQLSSGLIKKLKSIAIAQCRSICPGRIYWSVKRLEGTWRRCDEGGSSWTHCTALYLGSLLNTIGSLDHDLSWGMEKFS